MKDRAQRRKIYEPELTEITRAVKKLAEHHNFKDTCGIMHALCEVVANVTRDNDMGFEDYVRCALCAWDCSNDKNDIAEKDRSSWN